MMTGQGEERTEEHRCPKKFPRKKTLENKGRKVTTRG